jgi:hypothetical protein
MKNNISVFSLVLFLSIFMMFVSCRAQKAGWKGTIEEENGITVVKNPDAPIYSEDMFSMEEELAIGEAEGKEEYMFQRISTFAVNEAGDIYVLDYQAKHIKVFNKNGQYIKTFGRPGQGPGEFQIPRSLICTNQKEIVVGGINRMSYFTLAGEFVKSVPVVAAMITTVDIDSSGNILCYDIVMDKGVYELKKFDPDFKYLFSYGTSPLQTAAQRAGGGRNPFFSLLRWDVINGDQIVCGYAVEGYKIKIYDDSGNLIKRIEKDYTPLEVTQREVDERIANYRPEMKKNLDIPKYFPPFRWMISDDEGRIYVWTYERAPDGEGFYYNIFDAEGKYIFKVLFKTRPHEIKKNKFYTIEEDEDGFQYVKRYRMNWILK